MKKSKLLLNGLPLLIGTLFLMFACHKEKPVQLPSDYVLGASCSNGIKDDNEDGVDCGGVCGPCTFSEPNCHLDNYYNDVYAFNSTVSFTQSTSYISNGKYVILSTNNNGDSLKFTFLNENIVLFSEYDPSSLSTLDTEKVFVEAGLNSLPYTINYDTYYNYESTVSSQSNFSEQHVHVNKQDGKITVSFCELRLKELSQGAIKSIKGKIVLD